MSCASCFVAGFAFAAGVGAFFGLALFYIAEGHWPETPGRVIAGWRNCR